MKCREQQTAVSNIFLIHAARIRYHDDVADEEFGLLIYCSLSLNILRSGIKKFSETIHIWKAIFISASLCYSVLGLIKVKAPCYDVW